MGEPTLSWDALHQLKPFMSVRQEMLSPSTRSLVLTDLHTTAGPGVIPVGAGLCPELLVSFLVWGVISNAWLLAPGSPQALEGAEGWGVPSRWQYSVLGMGLGEQ